MESNTDNREDKKFYMTYERNRPDDIVPWVEENNIPLLVNAMTRWSENTERFLHMWDYDTNFVIDAGGYNVQASFTELDGTPSVTKQSLNDEKESDAPFYPCTVEEYHNWLSENSDKFEWATTMDFACEERFDSLWSVEERKEQTVKTAIKHYDMDPDYKLIPVLQGRSVDDYVDSYQRLEDAGIPTDHVGIGTVCRISSQNEIVEVEKQIRDRTGVEKIHGFGVKVSAYKLGSTFDTADSAAWLSNPMNKKVFNICHDEGLLKSDSEQMYESERRSESSRRRTVHSFQAYYAYVTSLMNGEPDVPVESIIERQKLGMDEYINYLDSL